MNVNSAYAVIAVLVLAACAGADRPEPVIRVERVQVPVPVPCVDAVPDRPESPVNALTPDAHLGDMVKALLAERSLMNAYTARLEATLKSCTAGVPDTADN